MSSTDTDEPSIVDELAADAAPDEHPEGAPLLKPYLAIRPRSRRAAFKRKFAEFSEFQAKIDGMKSVISADDPADDSEDRDLNPEKLQVWAEMDDLLQLMDELMEMAAESPQDYREWSDQLVDDNDLVRVFNVFMKRTQPGEALRSAT